MVNNSVYSHVKNTVSSERWYLIPNINTKHLHRLNKSPTASSWFWTELQKCQNFMFKDKFIRMLLWKPEIISIFDFTRASNCRNMREKNRSNCANIWWSHAIDVRDAKGDRSDFLNLNGLQRAQVSINKSYVISRWLT